MDQATHPWFKDAPYLWNRPYYSIFIDALTANVAFTVLGFLANEISLLPFNQPLGVLFAKSASAAPLVLLFVGLLYLMLLDWSVARYIDSYSMHQPSPWSWRFTLDVAALAGFYGAIYFACVLDARMLLCMAEAYIACAMWCILVWKQGTHLGIREQCRAYVFTNLVGFVLSLGGYEALVSIGQAETLNRSGIIWIDVGIVYWILFEKGIIERDRGLFMWHRLKEPFVIFPRKSVLGKVLYFPWLAVLSPVRALRIVREDKKRWFEDAEAMRSAPPFVGPRPAGPDL